MYEFNTHFKMKKIGRNDPCPCGSGEKNKKCCNIQKLQSAPLSINKTVTTVFDYIETHESGHILNAIIGMQLIPENHGKNQQIEELAVHAMQNLNNGLEKDNHLFSKMLSAQYKFVDSSECQQNLFSETIVFHGGNFTVFPGIALQPVETFKKITEIVFTTINKLPNDFKAKIYSGISLMLLLGKRLTEKSGIHGNIEGGSESDDIKLFHPDTNFSITKVELANLCFAAGISPLIIREFILSPADIKFQNEPELNALLYFPIVEFNDAYYFLLISNQLNAINEFILRSAKEFNCDKELLQMYSNDMWSDVMKACDRMHWSLTDISLPELAGDLSIQEEVCQFDHNRFAYIVIDTPPTIGDVFKQFNADRRSEQVAKRLTEVISDLKSRQEHAEAQFLTLYLCDSVGRHMFSSMRKPQERELKILFSAYEFITLASDEQWNRLSLWKFAKSLNKFLSRSKSMSSILDMYNIYKSKGESFYFSDDAVPDLVMLVPGEGNELITKIKLKDNHHGVMAFHNDELVIIPVALIADFAPIYKPVQHMGYFLEVLESYGFPFWITNKQIKSEEMVSHVRNYADAIGFWLHKLKDGLAVYLTDVIRNPVELELVLHVGIFKELTSLEMSKDKKDMYSYCLMPNNKIIFNIPFSSMADCMGSTNDGERKMMSEVINALNLIAGVNIPPAKIQKVLDTYMPLSQAKMILISDSQQDLMIDRRWLNGPFYMTDAEINMLLDELPPLVEKEMPIPENITEPAMKRQLFNTATTAMLQRLEKDIQKYDNLNLVKKLMMLHESLVQVREYNKTIIPAQLLCFGGITSKTEEILEKDRKLVSTSVSVRCLIEYLAACPAKGTYKVSLDEIDSLLVLMHEIINYGFLSDAVHFKMADPVVGKLKSGRIGVSREFLEVKLKPFAISNTKSEMDNYIENFDKRFDIYKKPELQEEVDTVPEAPDEVDSAFLSDWGVGYLNIYKFCYICAIIAINNHESVSTMLRKDLVDRIVTEHELPEAEVIAAIKRFSLSPREKFLTAPEGFHNNDVFPWKYNREFSLVRRFLVQHFDENGNEFLTWGFRNAMSCQRQLSHLLYEGKLNNGGKKINKILGRFNKEKGKLFRDSVRDWLKLNTNLIVIDYEVKISDTGPLIGDTKLGDIDILAFHVATGTVFSIECKDTNRAKNIHEMKTEMDSYLGRDGGPGMITKHVERNNWLENNKEQLQDFFKTKTVLTVKSLMLSSEVIPTPYIQSTLLPMPIVAFPDLKREGLKILFN